MAFDTPSLKERELKKELETRLSKTFGKKKSDKTHTEEIKLEQRIDKWQLAKEFWNDMFRSDKEETIKNDK